VFEALGPRFLEILISPFGHAEMVWGIVPLYFGWIVNELTSAKPSYHTAIQTGFSFMWAGAHWSYQYLSTKPTSADDFNLRIFLAVNVTEVREVPRPHAVLKLFHDHNLPDAIGISAMVMGTIRGDPCVRGADLDAVPFRSSTFAKITRGDSGRRPRPAS